MESILKVLLLLVFTLLGVLSARVISYNLFKKFKVFAFSWAMPVYILVSTLVHFDRSKLFSLGYIIWGQLFFVLLALVFIYFFRKEIRHIIFTSLAFQNSGYLPIPIVFALFGDGELIVMIFLFLIGFNTLLFSFGYYVLNKRTDIKQLLNPPLLATILAILIVLLTKDLQFYCDALYLPSILYWLNIFINPYMMFIFGGLLVHNAALEGMMSLREQLNFSLIKFVLFPFIVAVVVFILKLSGMIKILFIMQAIMPPAVNLFLLPDKEKDQQTLNQLMFFQYMVFIVLSLFFLVWQIAAL